MAAVEKQYRDYDAVFPIVKTALVQALGVDDDEVTDSAELTRGLGAESIDTLDVSFRLEKAFIIDIPQSELSEAIGYERGTTEFMVSVLNHVCNRNDDLHSISEEMARCFPSLMFGFGHLVRQECMEEFLAKVTAGYSLDANQHALVRACWMNEPFSDKQLSDPENYWLLPAQSIRRLVQFIRAKTATTAQGGSTGTAE
ncbi:MAG TPA: acyl carrier protein [Candidatus Peribacterales bacterium]|nr:acyl carrier protein [Candidatus Peribacterales bacterium]